jgi:hypothetical protein
MGEIDGILHGVQVLESREDGAGVQSLAKFLRLGCKGLVG